MTNPIDPERMAALLDGRLNADERSRLLERVSESNDSIELLADATAIVYALDTTAGEISREPARGWTHWRRPAWRVAAGVVLAAGVSVPLWIRLHDADFVDGSNALALLSVSIDRTTPRAGEPGRALRGQSETVTVNGRAVRVGAQTIDLEIALRTGDTGAASATRNRIAALVADVPASAPLLTALQRAQAGTSRSDSPLPILAVRNDLGSLLGRDWVATGAFIQAARVAAVLEDRSFFRNSTSRSLMERIADSPALDSTARQAAVRALASGWGRGTSTVDWLALRRELGVLLDYLARCCRGQPEPIIVRYNEMPTKLPASLVPR